MMTPEEVVKAKKIITDYTQKNPVKLTPISRRMIIICLGVALVLLIIFAGLGIVSFTDLKVPIASIITGFFTLLTGDR